MAPLARLSVIFFGIFEAVQASRVNVRSNNNYGLSTHLSSAALAHNIAADFEQRHGDLLEHKKDIKRRQSDDSSLGVLIVPEDIVTSTLIPPEEEEFSQASFEGGETEQEGQQGCPAGYGIDFNDKVQECKKARGDVGGFTFIDSNNNFNKDQGEEGVAGIVVTISNKVMSFRASVRTDVTGRYQIKNLPAGVYYLTIDVSTAPRGLKIVQEQATIAIQPFTALQENFPFQGSMPPEHTAAGVIGPGSVFIDKNANGYFDAGDEPAADILIELVEVGGKGFSTGILTNPNGVFTFTGLDAGTYIVRIDESTARDGMTSNEPEVTVTVGDDETFSDIGFVLTPPPPSAAIGPCYVFLDNDKNNEKDGNDVGLPYILVRLYRHGTLFKNAVSDQSGMYAFTELPADDYVIQMDVNSLPATFKSVRPQGKVAVTLGYDEVFTDANFAVQAPAKGDVSESRVFIDSNTNGVYDSGERGIPNVRINLVDNLGKVAAAARSDSNGAFQFKDLLVGVYRVQVDSSTVSKQLVLHDPVPVNVEITENGSAGGISIRAELLQANIGPAFAYVDDNGNNKLDRGEAAVPGLGVVLLRNGRVVSTTETDKAGKYMFQNIEPGVYVVEVDRKTIPFGFSPIKADGSYTISLTAQQTATGPAVDIPFVKRPLASIKGTVTNRNLAIPNVGVTLLDSSGTTLQEQTTNGNGEFVFTGLQAGTYNIFINPMTLPTGLIPADKKTGKVAATVKWGDTLSMTFKYQEAYGTIGPGKLFVDNNRNAMFDEGEAAVAGISVDLMHPNGKIVATTKTNSNGDYKFSYVAPSAYEVRIVQSTVPPQYNILRISYLVQLRAAQTFTGIPADFALAEK